MAIKDLPCGGFSYDDSMITFVKTNGKHVLKVIGEAPVTPFELTEGTDSAAMSAYGFEVTDNNGTSSMGLVESGDGTGNIVHGVSSNTGIEIKAKQFDMGDTPFIIHSSTTGSTKKFKIMIDDTGTITATEVV